MYVRRTSNSSASRMRWSVKPRCQDWHLRGEATGETAFDEADGTFERDGFGREQEMDVIGHDDESVKLVVAFAGDSAGGSR